MQTKRQAQLEALIAKQEAAAAERLAQLKKRLDVEQAKTKEVTMETSGVSDLIAMVDATASQNEVSAQRLLDFLCKQLVGGTARVMYRRKREPRQPKPPSVSNPPAAKKSSRK